ncbi:MAG TPA: hypothetical protein VI256_11665 [Roseiarcus sp.]|jgi:hypothetical protein
MNCLKLCMSQADPDQQRQVVAAMEEFFQVAEGFWDDLRRGGTKEASASVQPPGPIQF